MIYDNMHYIENYCDKGDEIYQAVKFVANFDQSLPDGKYPIDGEAVYAIVQSLTTSSDEERLFECHQHHIDVHMVLQGSERHDMASIANVTISVDPSKVNDDDAMFFDPPEDYSSIIMKPGLFVIYMDTDGHRPGTAIGEPEDIRKVCVKIQMT